MMSGLGAVQIARVCHAVNRAYCKSIGDDSQKKWDDAEDWQKESAVHGALFHMMEVDSTPADSHENWKKVKEEEGWVFGLKKDPEKKTHPCMVEYDCLPVEQQAKDYIFHGIVKAILAENKRMEKVMEEHVDG